MTERATVWSVTINNPTADDEECLNLARQAGWQVDGQKEKGESGTEHYQLIVKTPQVRFSAVKRRFPRAHIEVARNPRALATYVTKEDTRVSSLPTSQEMYPSQKRFFELVWQEILADPNEPEFRRLSSGRFPGPQIRSSLIEASRRLIRKGYVVETIAVNPQTMLSWQWFHLEFLARETNRQTDTAVEQAVEVPTVIT